jgi:hypothetical protein
MKYLIPFLLFLTSCAHTCQGIIGASYSLATRRIDYTLDNSPAARLGLLPGDELLYPELLEGNPGDMVMVRIIRGDRVLLFPDVVLACKENLTYNNGWKPL